MKTITVPAKFKAVTMKASTYEGAMTILRGGYFGGAFGHVCMAKTTGCVLSKDAHKSNGIFRLYRLQKFNKKSSQAQVRKTRGKDKGRSVSTMTVIRKPYWELTYIDVPIAMVKHAQQFRRTFSLTIGN